MIDLKSHGLPRLRTDKTFVAEMRFGRSKLPLRVVSQIFLPSFSSESGRSHTRLEHGPARKKALTARSPYSKRRQQSINRTPTKVSTQFLKVSAVPESQPTVKRISRCRWSASIFKPCLRNPPLHEIANRGGKQPFPSRLCCPQDGMLWRLFAKCLRTPGRGNRTPRLNQQC